jgi:thymidylate synthase
LIWFLRGDTNIKYLVDNGCNIWNKDAYNYYLKACEYCDLPELNIKEFIIKVKEGAHTSFSDYEYYGDLGKVYGHYWRDYDGFDQIEDIIDKMTNTPMSSEIIVTARNPNDKDNQALPCCHYGFQIVMRPLNYTERLNHARNIGLTCKTTSASKAYKEWDAFFLENNIPKYGFELHWNQRSVDTFLGLPYNIASYATLALILERMTGQKALGIQGDLKKVHLYDNSLDAVKEQLSRDVNKYDKCELDGDVFDKSIWYESLDEILGYSHPLDFELQNYESYPAINVEMLERDE